MPKDTANGRRRASDTGLVRGYTPEVYEPLITIDQWGKNEDERAVVYPDNSIIKSTRGMRCFQVEGYIGEGKHKVKPVGVHDSRTPVSKLDKEVIYGLADNKCVLTISNDEVLFSAKFDMFKEIADELLEDLPEDRIDEFSQSEHFELYKKVMSDGITEQYKTRKQFAAMVDDLLGDLPEDKIEEFMEDEDFVIYKEVADHYRLGNT